MTALTIAATLAALKVGEALEKIEATKQQAKATEDSIRARETEEKIAAEQKTIARDRQLRTTIGHQVAVEAASGFELNSPTFQAITMDDFNKFAENRSNDALELDLKENQLQQDMIQTKLSAKAQITGDVLSTAASFIPASGLFTNIASSTIEQKTKLATPIDQDEFSNSQKQAKEKRQSGDGLFDNLG